MIVFKILKIISRSRWNDITSFLFTFNFCSISVKFHVQFFSISCSISVQFQFFFYSIAVTFWISSKFWFVFQFYQISNVFFYYITGNGKRKGKGKNGGKGKRKDCRQSRKLIYQVCERFSVINYGMGSGKGKKDLIFYF